MKPERWLRVKELFEAALEREAEERSAFLDEACAGNESLRVEVEGLIVSYEQDKSFMERPAVAGAARSLLEDQTTDLPERSEDDLSGSPSLVLNIDGPGGDGAAHDAKSGAANRRRIILVGLFFSLMSVGVGVNSYHSISYFTTAGDPGWLLGFDGRVRKYDGLSAADVSALRDGDEVVSLDGQKLGYIRKYFETFTRLTPGATYMMVVRRDGRTEAHTLHTASYHVSVQILAIFAQLVLPATFLLIGLAVFFLRRDDKQALLLALMLGMSLGGYPPSSLVLADLPWWLAGIMTAVLLVGACAVLPVILHFFLIFPERSPVLVRFPRVEYYLYPLFLLTAYPFFVIAAFHLATGPDRFFDEVHNWPWLLAVSVAIGNLYWLSALLSLVVNYRRGNQVSRRKLRLILVGTLPSHLLGSLITPLFLILKPSVGLLWLAVGAGGLVMLFPLSFAYAIVRHQVIPVSLIIRRSVQYLLAKNGLRVILILPIIGLLMSILANRGRTLGDLLFHSSIYFYLLFTVTLAFSLMVRRRLSEWIDRRFFREAYNQEKILRELTDDLKRFDTVLEMSKHVSEQVERALHPEHLYLFIRQEEKSDLLLGYSSGVTNKPTLRIPAEFRLLRFMENECRAADFPFLGKQYLPFVESAWLAGLGTKLIVPISNTNGRLTGLLLLGEKKSQVPYTATDRQILETVASQFALTYENVQLKRRVANERKINSEVLARFDNQDINLLRECPTCGACFDSPLQLCAKDQTELTLSLPVERTIEKRYRLDQLLGKGGMGAVYEAMDIRLHRRVAVKILTSNLFGNSEALQRFEREAQASARLSHPNIIAVHDYGLLTTQGAYLVMDLAKGETLGAIIKRGGKLDPAWAAEVFNQVLDGVGAAHRAGVIHRDLKPDNILITEGENGQLLARVLDFGLAKMAQIVGPDVSEASITSPGTIMGTFGYMAPEQLTGTATDERSDLFAVGVMVVEVLIGRRPFSGNTYHELLTDILRGTFSLPDDSQDGRRLDYVLQRCLAKDRAQRYASASEMQHELIPVLRCYRQGLG